LTWTVQHAVVVGRERPDKAVQTKAGGRRKEGKKKGTGLLQKHSHL